MNIGKFINERDEEVNIDEVCENIFKLTCKITGIAHKLSAMERDIRRYCNALYREEENLRGLMWQDESEVEIGKDFFDKHWGSMKERTGKIACRLTVDDPKKEEE